MYGINTLWNYPVEDLEDLRDLGGFFILYSIRSLQFIDLHDSILKKWWEKFDILVEVTSNASFKARDDLSLKVNSQV